MILKDLVNIINEEFPFALQEGYDNSGLLLGDPHKKITKGLICFDLTENVLNEAVESKCDIIISHHPLIFDAIKSLTGKNFNERILIKAVKNDIAIIAVHTNIDNSFIGVNKVFAEKLGLDNLNILAPKQNMLKKLVVFCPLAHAEKVRKAMFDAGAGKIGDYDSCSYNLSGEGSFRASDAANPFVGEVDKLHFEPEVRIETIFPEYLQNVILNEMIKAHPYEEVAYDIYSLDNKLYRAGAGMIGNLKDPLKEEEFLKLVKNSLNASVLKHSELMDKEVLRVAVCGGSGGFLLENAIRMGADAFISGDIKYHQFLDSQNNILLVDAGHFETEHFTSNIIYEIVSKKITNFALQISQRQKNAVNYF